MSEAMSEAMTGAQTASASTSHLETPAEVGEWAVVVGLPLARAIRSNREQAKQVRELIASPEGGGPPGVAAAVHFGFAVTVAVGFVLTILGGGPVLIRKSPHTARTAKRGRPEIALGRPISP